MTTFHCIRSNGSLKRVIRTGQSDGIKPIFYRETVVPLIRFSDVRGPKVLEKWRQVPKLMDQGTVLLAVQKPTEVPVIEGFVEKPEHHVTLIGFSRAKAIRSVVGKEKYSELMANFDWGNLTWYPGPEFSRIRKTYADGKVRESVVLWGTVDGLYTAFKRLSATCGMALTPPPAHCTVLVQMEGDRPSMGIGIDSLADAGLEINPL